MTKNELFLELAKPNAQGVSRWVRVTEFVGKYADLAFGNGASWARKESSLAKKYIVEFDKANIDGITPHTLIFSKKEKELIVFYLLFCLIYVRIVFKIISYIFFYFTQRILFSIYNEYVIIFMIYAII